ncbi:hypothetical protein BWI93_08735 [Siphonobacter sp. BAB-5385]|uniref:hypothetical protein n=1 Tax=unclassified Siphonobacter TaxID=2635712 RepID=UPI000B9EDCEC|nr:MULTISPECIES: hypothetical protein [unclassified Siphonobacter]OZI08475.1 hypothetical protein BWI93_08735 [Siphonobacter sp. BAB-5385]PMD99137.1 hypothetical protein BWI97_01645 [Siphonobacter sp. BAB-5405]
MKHALIYTFLLMALLLACQRMPSTSARQAPLLFAGYEALNPSEKRWADSLLHYALDHEALYTLADTLKPISTVKSFAFTVEDSTLSEGTAEVALNQAALDSVRSLQRILKALSGPELEFVLMPFHQLYERHRRYLDVVVCRRSVLDRKLRQYAPFFGQWGLTEGASAGMVVLLTEYEAPHDRYRAYGYLFGYPKHAVDFFVQASQQQKKTSQFVKRDFFHIPTHNAKQGYFTYAVPKGYRAAAIDSVIYQRAMHTLNRYRKQRMHYVTPQGLKAIDLLRAW